MKKNILVLFATLALLLIGVTPSQAQEKTKPTKVYLESNSIVYDGWLTKEANDILFKLYTKDIHRLILNCNGGDANLGLDLGNWVFNHNLDVEIRDSAFSSAANYVFTAGKNKYLHKSSLLIWHGGASSHYGLHIIYFRKWRRYLKQWIDREKAFFDEIQVKQAITNYGQRRNFKKYLQYNRHHKESKYIGWTYTLNALSKLGVKNIILLDDGWQPVDTSPSGKKKIFTIIDSDIE